MAKIWWCIALFFLLPGLFAQQESRDLEYIDSLLSRATQLLEENPLQALDSAKKAIPLSLQLQDSSLIRESHYAAFLANLYLGRREDAREAFLQAARISIPFGLRLEGDFGFSDPFYNWRYNIWNSCLEVLEDRRDTLTFDQIRSGAYDTAFGYNFLDSLNRESTYWVKMKIRGGKLGDTHLFSVGGGVFSWGNIDIYHDAGDAAWTHLRSGLFTKAPEKAIRDAFNYFLLPVTRSEHTVYLKLSHPNPHYLPTDISILHMDIDSEIELEGYRDPGFFMLSDPDGYAYTTIQRSIEIVTEGDKPYRFEEVRMNWDNLSPSLKNFLPIDRSRNYWLKLRTIGTKMGAGTQLFMVGNEYMGWPEIEIYLPAKDGGYKQGKSGYAVSKEDKLIEHGLDLFDVHVPVGDTVAVFIYVKGGADRHIPDGIFINHIDSSTFWAGSNRNSLIGGLLHGSFWIQTLFFLLLAFVDKERTHVYYVIFLASTSLFFLALDHALWRQIFSVYLASKPVIYLICQFFIGFGLLKFAAHYLDVTQLKFPWNKIILIMLGVIGLLAVADLLMFVGDKNYDVYSSYRWIAQGKMLSYAFILLFVLVMTIQRIRQRYTPAIYFLVAISGFMITGSFMLAVGLSDNDRFEDPALLLANVGLVFTIVLFSLGSGYRTRKLKQDKEEALEENLRTQTVMNENLRESNALKDRFLSASGKFVPHEFIRALGRADITEVNLGDHVQKEVTVLFSDIRGYTTLAEGMSPDQTYTFVKDLNQRIGPIIHQNQGFINEYMGDGILAIFPERAEDALKAAIDIQTEIQSFNLEREKNRESAIRLGIGLHMGKLIMGIIGDQARMSATVISDVVNTASRIESLTKHFGVNILLSQKTKAQIALDNDLHFRYLGKVQVKGKKNALGMFECFDGDPPAIHQKKSHISSDFEAGLKHYLAKDFQKAESCFKQVLSMLPTDLTTQMFLNKTRKYQQNGVPEGWTGVESMKQK